MKETYLIGSREKLSALYKEKLEIEKRLAKIDAEIGKIQRGLEEDDIVKAVSSAIKDDKKFVEWFIRRKEKLQKTKKRQEIKEKVLKGDLNDVVNIPNTTYLYALYHKEKMVYIGITKELKSRIYQHKRSDKVFDNYKILNIHSDRFMALKEENTLINQYNPLYNKQSF